MKRTMIYIAIAFTVLLIFTGCTTGNSSSEETAASARAISADDAKALIGTEGVTLIDVRTKAEYDEEHIDGATLLPLDEIEQSIGELNIGKNSTIIVYCRTGSRSTAAANTLVSLGYTKVYNLGGIQNWPYDTVSS